MRIIQKVNIVLKTVATIAIMRFERENILDLLDFYSKPQNRATIFVDMLYS